MLTEIEQLIAKDAIRELKYKHLRLLDSKDWEALAETFTTDVQARYADGQFEFSGIDSVMAFLKESPLGTDNVSHTHHAGAGEITVKGPDTASGIWRLINPMIFHEEKMNYQLLAFYIDEYRKENGEWKVSATGHRYLMETQFSSEAIQQNISSQASYPIRW